MFSLSEMHGVFSVCSDIICNNANVLAGPRLIRSVVSACRKRSVRRRLLGAEQIERLEL